MTIEIEQTIITNVLNNPDYFWDSCTAFKANIFPREQI